MRFELTLCSVVGFYAEEVHKYNSKEPFPKQGTSVTYCNTKTLHGKLLNKLFVMLHPDCKASLDSLVKRERESRHSKTLRHYSLRKTGV